MGVFHLLECPFASKVHGNSEMHTLIVILVYYLGCILISLNKPNPLWLFIIIIIVKINVVALYDDVLSEYHLYSVCILNQVP